MSSDARAELRLGLLVFLATLAASGYLLLTTRPLLFLGGLTDEWFGLGCNLAVTGTLGWENEPMLLRPPGYPAFIAGVLHATTRVPARVTARYTEAALEMVCLAQALLLAATASLLFAWLRGRLGDTIAATAALVFGLNPYCLLLPGLLHYDVLHIFLLVAGCAALDAAIARAGSGTRAGTLALAAAGVLWGIAALVRPVTLPLPLFVLIALLARGLPLRRALVAVFVFGIAMAATIAPWTLRNYRITGRFVPINVQGWAAVWGSTLVPLRLDANEYQWRAVGVRYLGPLYRRVTGEDYEYLGFLRHNVALEAAFKQEAVANLREKPQVYAWNVARALTSFALQLNTSIVSAFERIQKTGETVSQGWFWEGAEAERRPTLASRGMDVLAGALTLLAGIGIVRSVARRDRFAVVPGLVGLCCALAHALTFFDFTYYYLKLPFLLVFATLGQDALGGRARAAAWALIGLAVASSAAMLLGF